MYVVAYDVFVVIQCFDVLRLPFVISTCFDNIFSSLDTHFNTLHAKKRLAVMLSPWENDNETILPLKFWMSLCTLSDPCFMAVMLSNNLLSAMFLAS